MPGQILVLADGRVVVTLTDRNRVAVLEPAADPAEPLALLCEAPTPAEPLALAAPPGDARLVVASGWGHALSVLSLADLAPVRTFDLRREPRAVVLDDDGRRAFVAHAVGESLSVVALDGASPGTPDVGAIDVRMDGLGFSGIRAGIQGFSLARVGVGIGATGETATRLFAPMASTDPGSGVTSEKVYGSAGGVPVAPFVAVVDERSGKLLSRKLAFESAGFVPLRDLGGPARACMLPRAAAALGAHDLLVACQGVDALLVLDARARDPMQLERRRFAVPAGPTGVAVDGDGARVVVWSQFAHALAVIDPASTSGRAIASVAPAPREGWLAGAIARGRILFHASGDPRISKDGRACASCHPDGRDDGLTWATPEGSHQTIMLAGRLGGTAPFGWRGGRGALRSHVHDTWKRLGGRGALTDADHADLDALVAYLGAMRAPSTAGALGRPDAGEAARGQAIFDDPRRGCAGCHPGGGTDREVHAVVGDASRIPFDTPSLRFVGGTAPYFHDGRFGTLDELLRKSDGRMGHTGDLSAAEIHALTAYLETL